MKTFRIYIASLRDYNNGKLVGEWVDLPVNEEELQEVHDRLSYGGNTDIAIHDYENSFGLFIEEYDNIFKLNELAEYLMSFSSADATIYSYLIDTLGDSAYYREQILACMVNGEYSVHSDIQSMRDLGCYYLEEYLGLNFLDMDSILSNAIDLEIVAEEYLRTIDFINCLVPRVGWVELHTDI